MTINELEEQDKAFRRHLLSKAISDVRRAIKLRAEQAGRTDNLERQLALLLQREAAMG